MAGRHAGAHLWSGVRRLSGDDPGFARAGAVVTGGGAASRGWVAGRLAVGEPRVRLICVPQAGAGPSAFAGWRQSVPDGWELAPVELPGRGKRSSEPVPDRFEVLADALFEGLADELTMPYVLFGHSFGGSLAYEVARRVEAAGARAPLAVVVSGSRAPQVGTPHAMSQRPDDELVQWLVDNGGLPTAVLKYTGFVRLVVNAVRGDLRLAAQYLVAEPTPLRCPLHVFGGAEDQVVPPDLLDPWKSCAAGEFSLTVMPGGHMFPHTDPAATIAAVLERVPVPG